MQATVNNLSPRYTDLGQDPRVTAFLLKREQALSLSLEYSPSIKFTVLFF